MLNPMTLKIDQGAIMFGCWSSQMVTFQQFSEGSLRIFWASLKFLQPMLNVLIVYLQDAPYMERILVLSWSASSIAVIMTRPSLKLTNTPRFPTVICLSCYSLISLTNYNAEGKPSTMFVVGFVRRILNVERSTLAIFKFHMRFSGEDCPGMRPWRHRLPSSYPLMATILSVSSAILRDTSPRSPPSSYLAALHCPCLHSHCLGAAWECGLGGARYLLPTHGRLPATNLPERSRPHLLRDRVSAS